MQVKDHGTAAKPMGERRRASARPVGKFKKRLASHLKANTMRTSAVPSCRPRYACPRCRRPVDVGKTLDRCWCTTCGFQVTKRGGIFSFVADDINEWQKFFEDKAGGSRGNTISGSDYSTSLQHRYVANAFRKICGDLPDGAVALDAGCGNGLLWTRFLAPRPVVGIDYSLRMCELASARGITAHRADISNLPFADDQFDLIYCAEILQYIEDLPALLKEFARVCANRGRIVVSTVNRKSLLLRSVRTIRRYFPRQDVPPSFRYFTRSADEIVEAARGLPLAVGSVAWTHFPIPWLHRSTSKKRSTDWLAWNVFVEFAKLPT